MTLLPLIGALALFGQMDDFDAIRPILESRCVRCHNEETAKGGLSLATRSASLEGGDAGPAIEPGKPDESLMLDMIAGDKPAMPKQGEPLSPDDVAKIRRWIEAGAAWPEDVVLAEKKAEMGPWWAVQPLKRPSLPVVSNPSWPSNAIDVFILAQLEANGLFPRPEADRRTLIRRLSFDLLGLPPSPEEVSAFEQDARPDAYERLVDRMLASPAYGERWGRHWLDVVHYADTHGYDKDKRRDHAWPYRDYVIMSLNEDKPYARFAREQIAGDVLWPDDPQATIATGFIAAGPWDFVGHVELAEGTVEKEKTRVIDRDDMVANTISTFASLTVHCARCHDHKFDPIPQRDYYQLQAVFAGVERGDRPFDSADRRSRREALVSEADRLRVELDAIEVAVRSAAGAELTRLDEESAKARQEIDALEARVGETNSPSNGYHSSIHANADALAWVQVDLGEALPIEEIRLVPARPIDFPDSPGFGFPKVFRVEVGDDPSLRDARLIHQETRGDESRQGDVPFVIDAGGAVARYVRVTATRLWPRTNDYVFALAELEVSSGSKNVALGAAVSAFDSIEAGRWSTRHLVDGYSSRGRLLEEPESRRRAELLAQVALVESQRVALLDRVTEPETRARQRRLRERLEEVGRALERLAPEERVYAAVPREPRPIHILKRGEVEQPAEEVAPGALACVPGLESVFAASGQEGARRAALADWVVSPANMLTWRSVVNRVWQYHFGRGLVETPNDFGRNGSSPTHPELLDWLAVEFQERGESLKALHRLIVTSATYRQSSRHDERAAAIDGENRLLWRQNRRRLEAEAIRDAVLAASGGLERRMYGAGFAVFRFKDDHSPTYDHEDRQATINPEGRRRAVYRFVVRSVPNPWIDCMDGADPNINVPVRNATITALQALALLNDPFMLEEARRLADRAERERGDFAARVDRMFELALGRRARVDERAALLKLAEERGLGAAARVVFNLSEFVFVD